MRVLSRFTTMHPSDDLDYRPKLGAAAIRELEAKLEASEQRLHEVEADLERERLLHANARDAITMCPIHGMHGTESGCPQCAVNHAPADIAVLRQANIDLAQESHIRATLLQEWLDAELDSQDEEYQPWLDDFTARVMAALPQVTLAPERAVAAPKNCRDNGWHPTCDRCAVADYEHCRYTTAAPASPLAPGRERAAETCKHDRKIIRGNDYGSDLAWCDDCGEITWASDADWPDPITRKYSERVDWFKKRVIAFGCCKEAKPVDKWNDGKRCEIWCNHTYCPVSLKPAEISRLKGEGRGS